MINLEYYKVSSGIIVNTQRLYSYFVNGNKTPVKLRGGWSLYVGDNDINTLQVEKSVMVTPRKFVLSDVSLASAKIPLELSLEDVVEYEDDDSDYLWSKYSNLKSLYKTINAEYKIIVEDVEFTKTLLGEIEGDITKPIEATFRIKRGGYNSDPVFEDKIEGLVHYSQIDEILVPEFAIHTKPCAMNSETAYKIVRTYIKENLNPKIVRLTSDYDFCLTVSKQVKVKPSVSRKEMVKGNGKSYSPPRFQTSTVEFKSVEIYRTSPKGYQDYPVIEKFKGENLEDLVNNVNKFLHDLITYINLEVEECSCCNGTGHIIDQSKLNKK